MNTLQDAHTFSDLKELLQFIGLDFDHDWNFVLGEQTRNLLLRRDFSDRSLAALELSLCNLTAVSDLNFETLFVPASLEDCAVLHEVPLVDV